MSLFAYLYFKTNIITNENVLTNLLQQKIYHICKNIYIGPYITGLYSCHS